jgi:hypothetical protein
VQRCPLGSMLCSTDSGQGAGDGFFLYDAFCLPAPADADAQLVVVISATGEAPRLVSKYRPFVPQVGTQSTGSGGLFQLAPAPCVQLYCGCSSCVSWC